jgi:hypothetical protein
MIILKTIVANNTVTLFLNNLRTILVLQHIWLSQIDPTL